MCISQQFIPGTVFTTCIFHWLEIYYNKSLPPLVLSCISALSTLFSTFKKKKKEISISPPTYLSVPSALSRLLPSPPCILLYLLSLNTPFLPRAKVVLPGVAPLCPSLTFSTSSSYVMPSVCSPWASVNQQAIKRHSYDPAHFPSAHRHQLSVTILFSWPLFYIFFSSNKLLWLHV